MSPAAAGRPADLIVPAPLVEVAEGLPGTGRG